jgi:hypothetical protein
VTEPSPRAPAIVYAVFCGADTSLRLAREWGITVLQAKGMLKYARKKGWIEWGNKRRMPTRANEESLRSKPDECRGCLVRTYRVKERR